jgi:hypothetical protein
MTCGGNNGSCLYPRWVNDKNASIAISVITRLPRSTIRWLEQRTFLSEIPEPGVQLIYQLSPGGVEVAR